MFRAVEPILESMEILNEFLDDFKLRISLLFAFGQVAEISNGLFVTGVLERVGSNQVFALQSHFLEQTVNGHEDLAVFRGLF